VSPKPTDPPSAPEDEDPDDLDPEDEDPDDLDPEDEDPDDPPAPLTAEERQELEDLRAEKARRAARKKAPPAPAKKAAPAPARKRTPAPAPAKKTTTKTAALPAPAPRTRRYGSSAWFGARAYEDED
jgi:hypothetical protein